MAFCLCGGLLHTVQADTVVTQRKKPPLSSITEGEYYLSSPLSQYLYFQSVFIPDTTDPDEAEPAEAELAETEPAETEPAEAEAAESEPAETEAEETEPADAEAAETEPAEADPAATGSTEDAGQKQSALHQRTDRKVTKRIEKTGQYMTSYFGLETLGNNTEPVRIQITEDGFVCIAGRSGASVLGIDKTPKNGVEARMLPLKSELKGNERIPGISDAVLTAGQKWIVGKNDDETYYIRSAEDTKYLLTVDTENGLQNARLVLREADGSEEQKFCLSGEIQYAPRPLEEDQKYFVRLGSANFMLLSIGDRMYDDERNAYIYASDSGDGQIWTIRYDDYGFAVIHHNDSSKVLTVRNNDPVDGQDIGQCEFDGSDSQRWLLEEIENGGICIRSAMNLDKAITLANGEQYNHSPVCLSAVIDSYDQYWYFLTEAPNGKDNMDISAQNYSSGSGYLIMVDTFLNHVGVYQGSYGNWSCLYFWPCVTGRASNPTPKGEYSVFSKVYSFDGNMDSPTWYTCYYATQWWPAYYFHSIIYYQGTWNIMDASMGVNASHGCVRLATDNAKWIYDNIPAGTKVVVY